jgi:CheY-like chemotaxis protein
MGGSIELDSEPGRGSTFSFKLWLPLAEGEPMPEAASTTPRMTGLRTLVVDDNPTARRLLSKMLRALGWEVEVACDVDEALQSLARQDQAGSPCDVAFIDGQLPALQAWHASQAQRVARGAVKPLVVTMVTAQGRETLSRQGLIDDLGQGCFALVFGVCEDVHPLSVVCYLCAFVGRCEHLLQILHCWRGSECCQVFAVIYCLFCNDYMSRRICIVVAFGRDAKRLETGVFIGNRHRFVRSFVARIHRFCSPDTSSRGR